MGKESLKKAIPYNFGNLICPYCNKWLSVRVEAKVIPGIVVCGFCGKEMLADEEICKIVNEFNTKLRKSLYHPREPVIYEGCKGEGYKPNQNQYKPKKS